MKLFNNKIIFICLLRTIHCNYFHTLSFLLIVPPIFLISGCNQTFEPIADDPNATFSIYGYVDASADTQWIRIIPPRQQVDMFEEKPEMRVTLTNVETGNSAVMNDSLILSRDGRHMLVVWTTMDIEPEQSYRLNAERPDGAESHVTVTTPPDFPTPVLKANTKSLSGELLINGPERIADVQTLWKEKGRVPYRKLVERTDTSETSYTVSLKIGHDLRYLCQCDGGSISNSETVEPRQIFVASGGPEWQKEIPSLTDLEFATLETVSNVEGGVGYVVGIVSKTIPFKGCFKDGKINIAGENIACPLEKPFRY